MSYIPYLGILHELDHTRNFEGLPATEEELLAKRPEAEESVPVGQLPNGPRSARGRPHKLSYGRLSSCLPSAERRAPE